jgi:hypothetical protein
MSIATRKKLVGELEGACHPEFPERLAKLLGVGGRT